MSDCELCRLRASRMTSWLQICRYVRLSVSNLFMRLCSLRRGYRSVDDNFHPCSVATSLTPTRSALLLNSLSWFDAPVSSMCTRLSRSSPWNRVLNAEDLKSWTGGAAPSLVHCFLSCDWLVRECTTIHTKKIKSRHTTAAA
jgi:hypothetical protein